MHSNSTLVVGTLYIWYANLLWTLQLSVSTAQLIAICRQIPYPVWLTLHVSSSCSGRIIILCAFSTDGVVFHPSPPSSAGLFPAASLDTFQSVPDLPRLEGKHGTQHSHETKEEVKGSNSGKSTFVVQAHSRVIGIV